AAAEAGAGYTGYVPLRLPHAVKDLFEDWLERNYPDRKEKVLNRIRAIRGGKLNAPNFHSRMSRQDIYTGQIAELLRLACKKAGFKDRSPQLSTSHFRRPREQLKLFA